MPNWIVVDGPLVDEGEEGAEDGVLGHGLEDAAGTDHVGEAGGPGGQHHAHQHQRLEEGELRQGRLEAGPV